MAMNIPSNIRQVRGTSAQVSNVSAASGCLFYDIDRELFLYSTENGTKYFTTAGDINILPTIYVDSVNGSDDNIGFSEVSPLKTLDKAIFLANVMYNSTHGYKIKLAAGEYTCNLDTIPRFTDIYGDGVGSTILTVSKLALTGIANMLSDMTLNISDYSGSFCLAFYMCHTTLHNVHVNITGETDSSIIYIGDNSYVNIDGLTINCNNKSYKDILFVNYLSTCNININSILAINDGVCTRATATVGDGALLSVEGSMTGTVTGNRYYCYRGGIIQSCGKGASAIPGSSAGSMESNTGCAYY